MHNFKFIFKVVINLKWFFLAKKVKQFFFIHFQSVTETIIHIAKLILIQNYIIHDHEILIAILQRNEN